MILLAGVAFNYFQTRRARPAPSAQGSELLDPAALRSADRIEYSQHRAGHERFRILADRLLETKEGKNHLDGIEAFDFYPDGSVQNHIRSERAVYDKVARNALFKGDVRIGLGKSVELATESLRYHMNSGVGETRDLVEIETPQGDGTSRGVRYQNGQSIELLSDVDFELNRMVVEDGKATTRPYRIVASRASYSEGGHEVKFLGAAQLRSEHDELLGNVIESRLDPETNAILSIRSEGEASYQQQDGRSNRWLSGDSIEFEFLPSGGIEQVVVIGNASLMSMAEGSKIEIEGGEIRMLMSPQDGGLEEIQGRFSVESRIASSSSGDTTMTGEQMQIRFSAAGLVDEISLNQKASILRSYPTGRDELSAASIRLGFKASKEHAVLSNILAQEFVTWNSVAETAAGTGSEEDRVLSSDRLMLQYAEDGNYLDSGRADGGTTLTIAGASAGPVPIRRLEADRMMFDFFPGNNRLSGFEGWGDVRVTYDDLTNSPGGVGQFRTSSSHIAARFDESDGQVQEVVQSGKFKLENGVQKVWSDNAIYRGKSESMVLRGSPRISNGDGITTGKLMEYDLEQRFLTVRGDVRSVLQQNMTEQKRRGVRSSSPTVVTADSMEYREKEASARYVGAVEMLAEESQLRARVLTILDSGVQIQAHETVEHLLWTLPEGRGGHDESVRRSLMVRSQRMDYQRQQDRIEYHGTVLVETDDLELHADTVEVTLVPGEPTVQRAVASGRLRVLQPGRNAEGQWGEYLTDPGKFVVHGRPATIFEEGKGKSEARQLTFFSAGDRILLENPE